MPVLRHVKREKLRPAFENSLRQFGCTTARLGVNDKNTVGNRSDELVSPDGEPRGDSLFVRSKRRKY